MGVRRHEQSTRLGKDEDEKEKTSFSSSSFATTTTAEEWGDDAVAWPAEVAPADDAEAPNTTINPRGVEV